MCTTKEKVFQGMHFAWQMLGVWVMDVRPTAQAMAGGDTDRCFCLHISLHREGYDKSGYDKLGYDKEGYDK